MKKDLFTVGRVVKPHGVKGKMKVLYFGEDLSRFSDYREILIRDSTGRAQSYEILEAGGQPDRPILRLKGVNSVEETAPLLGKEIVIRKEQLPALEEREYYWFDILGMAVETEEGKRIGRVKEILPTGANDVYVVEGEKREICLPATTEVIRSIDVEKRLMKVNRKKGLWEEEDEG